MQKPTPFRKGEALSANVDGAKPHSTFLHRWPFGPPLRASALARGEALQAAAEQQGCDRKMIRFEVQLSILTEPKAKGLFLGARPKADHAIFVRNFCSHIMRPWKSPTHLRSTHMHNGREWWRGEFRRKVPQKWKMISTLWSNKLVTIFSGTHFNKISTTRIMSTIYKNSTYRTI